MNEMLRTLPTAVRLIVAGLIWGAFCGIGVVLVGVLLLVTEGVGSGGFYWGGAFEFIVGLPLYTAMYCTFGGLIGGVIGLLSGAVAGVVLAAMVRMTRPAIAVAATVIIVLAAQVVIALSISGSIWISAVTPVIGVIPMLSSVRDAATDWSRRPLAAPDLA